MVAPFAAAHAQVAAVGPASSTAPPVGTAPIRWPDVAFDPEHDVYLAVSGAGHIAGYWFSADGAPLDRPFVIDAGAIFAQAPRVTYAEGAGFVVAWHETVPGDAVRIRARLVTYGAAPLPGSFDVSPLGTNWEMGAALAWSTTSGVLLIAWQSTMDTRIGAQRVSATGALLGAPIVVDPRAYYFRDPAIAYHAATDTFFVAYAGCVGTNDCFVDVQRVSAGTGALVGGPIELDASIDAGYVPELAYSARSEDVLAVWHRRAAGGASFWSRLVSGDGTPSVDPVIVTDTLGSYDASSLAYAALSGSFLFVTHGLTSQDVAIELSAGGAPLNAPLDFGSASAGGNFNPRVAANGARGEWLAVTSADFTALAAQRFETRTRDPGGPLDGGASDASAPALDAAIPRVDGAIPLDATADDDAGRAHAIATGCGCRAGGAPHSAGVAGSIAWLLFSIFAARGGCRSARRAIV